MQRAFRNRYKKEASCNTTRAFCDGIIDLKYQDDCVKRKATAGEESQKKLWKDKIERKSRVQDLIYPYLCDQVKGGYHSTRTKATLVRIRRIAVPQDIAVLTASTARFLQFQRYAATLCQFLIFRVFKSFPTSSIYLVGGLPLVRDPIGFLNV
ncbi:hypothetical protein TNCV_878271 [Trichonephila clavipes]|nr:hypothetical protein TNCV_878271 [Trichonephila clavipes]